MAVVSIVFFGLLMLYSASSVNASENKDIHSGWHFLALQLCWAAVSAVVMMTLKRTSYRKFRQRSVAFGLIGVILAMLAAVYFLDSAHHRWLRLGGPIGVQPSELAKPALVIFLAFFISWRAPAINNARYTLWPAAIATGLVIFGVAVADLGTAVVLGVAVASVFFVAGVGWKPSVLAGVIGLAGVIAFVCVEPYRLGRVVRFFDPDYTHLEKVDPGGRLKHYIESHINKSLATHDTNYQSDQSKIAIGSGGALGLGLMNGRQKLLYLPEAHTDFIYAVVGEELGLVGTVGLLFGFGVIFWRGLRATYRMGDDFGRYLALGATVIVVVQALMNMSVVLGMMPTKGIPLPMVSYGGSSLLSTLALLGILMNVAEHAG
ncbi:MAG TPA: FtsW/RodA/SpoVE family cell cycle protein [Bryobacteraceae bacterium]|nr:FtsW/RodA/SpoVE family cell cycle protein [Bryobacteraceae bacterium]